MRLLLTAVVLMFGGLVYAEPPKVDKDTISVELGKASRIEITPDGDKAIGWKLAAKDEDFIAEELMSKTKKTRLLLLPQTAGTYFLVMWTVGEADSVMVPITVTGGKKPEPKPDDTDPKPKPVGKVNWYIVTESADKNPAYTPILQAKEVKGVYTVVVLDPNIKEGSSDNPPAKYKAFLDRAKGKADQLYGMDTTSGDIVYEGAAPTSVGDFLKAVQSVQ